jgi:DNA-binding CsgD family transcriptional regulator
VPADRREGNTRGLLATLGVEHEAAEAVWRALMRYPDEDLDGLSKHAGVSDKHAQAAINELIDSQILRESKAPCGAAAIDPRLAIETHIARSERQLADQAVEIADLRTHVAGFVDDYSHGRALTADPPVVEIVTDLDAVRQRIYLASESVRRVQRCLIRSPSAEGLQDGLEGDIDQLARGVEQRTIISAADLADPGVYEHIRDQHTRGERVRSLHKVPTQMQIMDDDLAILAVDPANPRHGAIFIRERGIVELLVFVFDHWWSEADVVFDTSTDSGAPTGRAARILELIAGGAKDEAIARTLGIATRTLRRDMAELRDRLGVSSRTEMVAEAIQRGWVGRSA